VKSLAPDVVDRLDTLLDMKRRYRCLYVDPPWRYDQPPRGTAENHYPTMSLHELHALPMSQLAMPEAHLHLWVTHSFFHAGVGLLESWGFAYKSMFVWVKPQLGMGYYWRSSSEFLLLGVRGKLPFQSRSIPNWLFLPRSRHSEKPELIRTLVEQVSPGPYLELFGRKAVPGWTIFGNQVEPKSPSTSDADLFTGSCHDEH